MAQNHADEIRPQDVDSAGLLYWVFAFAKGNNQVLEGMLHALEKRGLMTHSMPYHDEIFYKMIDILQRGGSHTDVQAAEITRMLRTTDLTLEKVRSWEDEKEVLARLLNQLVINDGNFATRPTSPEILKLREKTSVCTCVLLGKMPHEALNFLVPKLRAVIVDLRDEYAEKLRTFVSVHNETHPNQQIDLESVISSTVTAPPLSTSSRTDL